jgi:hypothetical protein
MSLEEFHSYHETRLEKLVAKRRLHGRV